MNNSLSTKVDWLLPHSTRSPDKLAVSNLASVRIRAALSMFSGQQNGISVVATGDRASRADADLLLVGKFENVSDPDRARRWVNYIETARKNGTAILIDYTDHHLATEGSRADFYKIILSVADGAITSSKLLKDSLSSWFDKRTIVIPDPVEVSLASPCAKRSSVPTALWFGHSTNLPYLFDFLCNRYSSDHPLRLIVMTNLHPLPDDYSDMLERKNLKNVEINVIPWSIEDMKAAATLADFCIIPAGVNDPRKSGASSNRLLTALALGLPTAADWLDSYQPFQPYFCALDSGSLEQLILSPEAFFPQVQSAQREVISEFTLDSIGLRWVSLFRQYQTLFT